jgi:hypothetical protein
MKYSRLKIMTIALLMEGVVFFLALLLASYFDITLFPLTRNLAYDILIGTAGAIPAIIFFLFLISERAKGIPFLGSLRQIVLTDIKKIFTETGVIDLVVISLLAGVSEELLFRGVIQAKFGIVVASVIFGLIHYVSPAYVIVTMVMGFYIGVFFYVSKSLLVPIQIHFIYDLTALIYLRYGVRS